MAGDWAERPRTPLEELPSSQWPEQALTEGPTFDASDAACTDSIKVFTRVRPPLERERRSYLPYADAVLIHPDARTLSLSENVSGTSLNGAASVENGLVYPTHQFTYDRVFGPDSQQAEVYEHAARGAVLSTLQGFNATVIAYGQTGTGKTYTMEGDRVGPGRGIIPRAIDEVFAFIENDAAPRSKYLVRAAFLQIYNEVISDLLKPAQRELVIREDPRRGKYVHGLSEWVVRSPAEVYQLMEVGAAARMTGATKLNERSSRSHAVFILIVEQSRAPGAAGGADDEMDQFRGLTPGMGRKAGAAAAGARERQSVSVGKLNLVDLAGSERVHITGATGRRLEESKRINSSLSALGNVIAALTDARGARAHVPYRDSKLTRLLEDSLGGNCKTTILAMISPALDAFPESLSTAKFAQRAKAVRNAARVNEDLDQRTLLRRYEGELRRLRAELQQRQRDVVDKRQLLQVEEQKRRAEADKLAAITALEQRSREFMAEKEAKRRLEARISGMQSQLLIGGTKVEDTPVFRTLLAREQQRMRGEYEQRLRDLESERLTAEHDKAKVDRYKALLVKQRDIMIALTARLNERDDSILGLQEELEAYDAHQKRLEDTLDMRTSELIALRKAAVEHSAVSPVKSAQLALALGAWATGSGHGQNAAIAGPGGEDAPAPSLLAPNALEERAASGDSAEASGSPAGAAPADAQELEALREACAVAAKERAALLTILDAKVGALVADIAHGLRELPEQAQAHPQLQARVDALQRLVAATVRAMSSGANHRPPGELRGMD
ncbi:hypothetical protein WJX81_008288 [Elliptochloris bilobata]|uniref:Kinesin-like protein n=1 Tax=Elliptochloris bilobata TaxID=381761 RepID=A0AAW1SKF2_9CHLO